MRSWRYAAFVNDCIIEKMWIEKGMAIIQLVIAMKNQAQKSLTRIF